MIQISTLIDTADRFLALSEGLREVTLSYRIFGDTKKLGALRREGVEITVGRFNGAMSYFATHWPTGADLPPHLLAYAKTTPKSQDAA